ncbi:hypothetical protein K505DRAFT_250117 [Melanomma pulvis-pyrius CBS 109.77]|uniref:Zn(2)-C6 fungal-type domain-containing protein n=1 Tax=Melanomma pulvis-pyrius CBS 109.77 TaxID=1314802 RepID=A0A6A6X3I2_9PLEO|nr:hypothetical protein K505DRAFT_250117 [Melanomma pulvis-pyrius CBS 109.77]
MEPQPQKRVAKACDACKLRKVKCNGQERCQQCSHLGLRCVYTVSAKQRVQYGKRGHLISEYKNKTANVVAAAPPILPASPSSVGYPSPYGQLAERDPLSPGVARIPYSQSFFLDLIPEYMEGVYPVQPVITENELRQYIQAMEFDQEIQSFMYAFAACTLNLTCYGDKRTEEVLQTIEILMNRSIETLRPPLANFRSSVMRAMQSMFIHNCLMSMQASDAAFHYMRDSISAIQLLRIDSADIMAPLPPHERSRRQRLYWQAYIHERFVAILDYRQAILPPLDNLPEDDPTIPLSVHEGFNQIIKLFRLLDSEFLKNWLGSQNQASSVTCAWVEAKSRELEGDEDLNSTALSMMQRADLVITREWLRTIVWRLAMSQALLSSRTSKECLSLLFPVRLSKSLRQQVASMSREDIEVHGSSIVQKLFEITDTIVDVLLHVPAATLEETALRIEDFLFILDFVLLFPALDPTRRSILLEKLERLQAQFPEVYSAGSSPNVPFDMQSPPSDPWYNVTQSKIGPDTYMDTAGVEDMPVLTSQQPPSQQVPDSRMLQRMAYNDISKRLSMANFATV